MPSDLQEEAFEEPDLRPPRRRRQDRPEPGAPLIVDRPQIVEVRDMDSGRDVPSAEVIGTDYDQLVQLRLQVHSHMRRDDPLYCCSICGVAVHICRRPDGAKFYFKHRHEDGNCPAITRGELSQQEIDARKYNGAKESRLHRQMKDWLCQCMSLDGRFESIEQEPRWKGALNGEWRRPDVHAVYKGQHLAFELQLSTTHLDVIAARRDFYLQEGGLLFWVFAEFDTEHRRMTDDDVFYNNNQNVFVVDGKTVEASVEAGEFKLECVWALPVKGGGVSGLHRRLVSFHDLTLEPGTQRAFFYDFAGEKRRLENDIEGQRQALRDDLERWWVTEGVYSEQKESDWVGFRTRLKRAGVAAPTYVSEVPKSTVKALYCAKLGRPVADDRKTLIEVAHGIAGMYKQDLRWFSHALRHYGTGRLLAEQDRTGKWKAKVKTLRAASELEPAKYEPDRRWQGFVEFLFPELGTLP